MKRAYGYGLPEIFQQSAKGELDQIYRDIQYVLKVPVINFIFRTTALYKTFFLIGWNQVRPNMLTVNMERAAGELRYPNLELQIPNIEWSSYYDQHTLDKLKRIIYTFNYVNTKLLIIASAWSESLANRTIKGGNKVEEFIQPGIIPSLPSINLLSVNQAPVKVKQLFLDIARVHRTFDVASDFRALGNYPLFLEMSWNYLKDYVDSDDYTLIGAKLKRKSIEFVHQMPYPVTVNRQMLSEFYSAEDIAGIMGVVSMFQQFLPPLIIDGEFFRRILMS